jgi:hypothetical protein
MEPAAPPRKLTQRTEKHYCVKCLAEVPAEEYFNNDFLCNKCTEKEAEYPLQTTEGTMNDER